MKPSHDLNPVPLFLTFLSRGPLYGSLHLIASLPLIIDAAYLHITITPVSSESISTGVF